MSDPDLDAEAVFDVCKTNLPEMLLIIQQMSTDVNKSYEL
jgi:hypothetical protein